MKKPNYLEIMQQLPLFYNTTISTHNFRQKQV